VSAQDAIAALVAAGALAWLLARAVRARRRGPSCADCPAAAPVPGVRPAPRPEVLLGIGEPSGEPENRR